MDHIAFIIPAAIAFIGVLAGVTGYYGKSRGDTVIALLKEEIDHYIRENGQFKEEIASLNAEKGRLIVENKRLANLAQGSPQLRKLALIVDKQAIATNALSEQVRGLLMRESER